MLWLCLLQGLDAETLEDRQRAVRDLIERGDEATARKALTSSDPEVRARAEEALEAIRWNALEGELPALLATEEIPVDDLQQLRFDELPGVRVYRSGEHLVALHSDGGLELAGPLSLDGYDFALRALRDIRARTPARRRELSRAAIRLFNTFYANDTAAAEVVWEDEDGTTWSGGWRVRFTREGRLESLVLWLGKLD